MAPDTLLCVRHLTRTFGTLRAVDDVSFDLRRGEVVGLLGPNGAGKSTTLQMVTGNLAPNVGAITIDGNDLLADPQAAKAALGYLPEQPPLYRELTVDEFLRYCARLHRIPRGRVAQALALAKERCGLAEVGRRLIGNLSKGYQQRVGIAQAIIHAPPLVVLDEPTVGLDPIQIREIRRLIRELGGEHTVILSTHILPEVQTTCDRVQIINRGTLVLCDTIDGLHRRMRTSSLRLALRRPPPPAELAAVPGVVAVEPLDGERLRLAHAPEQNPAEELVRRAVAGDWGLYELVPEQRTLEDIFVDITTAEPDAEAAA